MYDEPCLCSSANSCIKCIEYHHLQYSFVGIDEVAQLR